MLYRSQRNFAPVTTVKLSWSVQNVFVPIATTFCTRHDSVTVVTCAKCYYDRLSIFSTIALQILIEFRSNSIKIPLVGRAPAMNMNHEWNVSDVSLLSPGLMTKVLSVGYETWPPIGTSNNSDYLWWLTLEPLNWSTCWVQISLQNNRILPK